MRIFAFFALFIMSACGESTPKAFSSQTLQAMFDGFMPSHLSLEKVEVLSHENTGSDVEPDYRVRVKLTFATLEERIRSVYSIDDNNNFDLKPINAWRTVHPEGDIQTLEFLLRITRPNADWLYEFYRDGKTQKVDQYYFRGGISNLFEGSLKDKRWDDHSIYFGTPEEIQVRKAAIAELGSLKENTTDALAVYRIEVILNQLLEADKDN